MTINTHPTLPEFEYILPQTLVEASEFLSQYSGEARPFLGGTDVFVRMRDGFITPKFLVDVKNNDHVVGALMHRAQGFVHVSTREGFGLVVSEALWKSRPVVAGNTGGMKVQIKHGKTGYFYRNPKITADKILYLLNNPLAARELGRKGHDYVRDHFLIVDRMIDYLMAIGITLDCTSGSYRYPESITSFYPW